MAIKKIDEIMASVKEYIGDDTSDTALSIIEDVQDTFSSLSQSETENWKQKYEENDRQWRERYRERFFSGSDNDDTPEPEQVETPKLTFDSLFNT